MPTYLCHGFRWHRKNIRPFVILNNLEDAAPDWLIGPASAISFIKQMYRKYDFIPPGPIHDGCPASEPEIPPGSKGRDFIMPPPRVRPEDDAVLMHKWSAVKLLEEYDPDEMREPSRPYAFVAHIVIRIDLHLDVAEEMTRQGRLLMQRDVSWFRKLRDELQKDEEISWFVVVCGVEHRPLYQPNDVDMGADGSDRDNGKGKDVLSSSPPRKGLTRRKSRGEGLRRLFHRKATEEPPLPTSGDS